MITKEETVIIGKFQKTHALKGELNAILNIDPEFFEEGNPIIVEFDGILVPFFTNSIRPKGTTSFLIKLDGVESEEQASSFVNKEIRTIKNLVRDLIESDEEFIEPIVGFSVIDDSSGENVGTIDDLDTSTSNILLIVVSGEDQLIYIPYSEDFIVELDEKKRTIRMKLPDGLLDINKK
ncbi:MAG: 16S rRNA processing protein RimM [Muribaculaceae bacterium]|nr:16S rRNA processing protein RimM [Muribaculaceae bacterium]